MHATGTPPYHDSDSHKHEGSVHHCGRGTLSEEDVKPSQAQQQHKMRRKEENSPPIKHAMRITEIVDEPASQASPVEDKQPSQHTDSPSPTASPALQDSPHATLDVYVL